jgi:predicted Fe-S protein YdhL (DUF1289 family)
MGIYEGLDKIKKYKDDLAARKAAAEEGKINWLKIDDGEAVKVWFLQELDKGAEGYHEENGLGFLATEHTKPGKDNFRTKALCSMDDEEQCVGCEKHREDWKAGWRPKSRLYINVLVERKNGDREVAVMSQANGSKSVIAPMVLDYAVENNTITDRWWKITRTGEKETTTYTPFVYGPSTDVDVKEYADQIQDLKKCVREVPYDEQFDFFFSEPASASHNDEETPKAKPSASTDEEW